MRSLHSLIMLLLILLLAACGGASSDTTTSDTTQNDTSVQATDVTTSDSNPPPPTQNSGIADSNVVARVNGVDILRRDLEREFERYQQNTTITDETALREQVLDTLIEQEVIAQSAGEVGVTVTTEEVDAEMQGLRNAARDDAGWEQFLSQNGYTEAEMRDAQRDSLVTQRVRNTLMQPYEGEVEQVQARHILVSTEAAAQSLLDRLNAGEGFEALAQEASVDSTTRNDGGNLGWFTRDELTDPRLAEVAFELSPGQIAGPIETSLGFHIIQTTERGERVIEPERLPLLSETVFSRWLAEQMNTAEIQRNL